MKSVAIVALALGISASAAEAATIVSFVGNANGSLATGTATISLSGSGNSITGTLTNTAPFDARITGFGFDIGAGNLAGYTGTPDPITSPAGVNFDFRDDDLGNVPQFNSTELDFGYVTGPSFAGGSPNVGLDNMQTLSFMVEGSFAGLTEQQVASAIFVRFQRVGANGELSDVAPAVVGTPTQFTQTPEPASMILLGTGLLYLAGRKYKPSNT